MPSLYRAFGVTVRSPLELWPADSDFVDEGESILEVALCGHPAPVARGFSLVSDDSAFLIDGVATVRAVGGRRIELYPEPDVDPSMLAAAAAGPGLAALLTQRGEYVLHGSCVAMQGGAICIAGPSGAGKSTLAAGLHLRGHTLVSDGMTVLRKIDDGHAVAVPGPGTARLWPDAANHLGWDASRLPRFTSLHEKRVCAIARRPTRTSPVRRILVACAGSPPRVEPMTPGEGLMALVRNAYVAEYLDPDSAAALLEHAATIAAIADTGRLVRGSHLEETVVAAELVERAI